MSPRAGGISAQYGGVDGSCAGTDKTRTLRLGGIAASVGAFLWAWKSLSIVLTEERPDFAFEIALFLFGVSVTTFAYALKGGLRRSSIALGWLATIGGGLVTVAYLLQGDDGLFGPAATKRGL